MTFLCALETRRVGLQILPVVESFMGSISILLVIAFALLCSTSLFWGLSNRSTFSVFRSMFRLGLLADFDVEDDIHGGIAESVGWEYIAFVLTAFFISLSLMNIFIGHMTGLYDHFQSRAVELFVRRRALTSMHYILQAQYLENMLQCTCSSRGVYSQRTRQLWVCFKDTEHSDCHDEDGDMSLRHFLKSEIDILKSDIAGQHHVMKNAVERLEREVEGLKSAKIGKERRDRRRGERERNDELGDTTELA